MRQSLHLALGGSSNWHSCFLTADGNRKTGALGSSAVSAVARPEALPLLLTVSERNARGNPGLDGTFCLQTTVE